MKWPVTKIGMHCTVTSSKRFHLSERTTEGVPFYCSKEIIQKCRGEEVTECDYIPEELYLDIASKFGVPQANDLLVTTRGTIGVPYLYQTNDRFYFADGNLTWLKDFDDLLLPQYLYYWFLTNEGKKKINAIAKGTAQKAVPIVGIKDIEVQLPPLATQRRIADILSAYDDLIENNQKQIKLLEEAAQRLYREWFVELRFPGHERTPVVDGVPEGWERVTMGSVVEVRYGKDHKGLDDGNIPVYGSGGLMRKCSRSLYTGESVLIPRKGSLNNIMYVNEAFWTVDTMFYTHMKREHLAVFVYFFVKSFDMYSMNIGAAVPSMTTNTLDALEMLLPAKSTLKAFDRQVQQLYRKIHVLRQQIEIAQETRDRLLPKLMSGEVEV